VWHRIEKNGEQLRGRPGPTQGCRENVVVVVVDDEDDDDDDDDDDNNDEEAVTDVALWE
jgi:hypothetical protein